jgi:putative peptidoglycan lipid II flippase
VIPDAPDTPVQPTPPMDRPAEAQAAAEGSSPAGIGQSLGTAKRSSELGTTSIASAAAIILLGSLASRLLGLVREQVMAWLFGATGGTDAFVVASAVPTMVYDLLVGGAITAALVPVFVDYAHPAQAQRLWRLVSVVLNLTALALGLVVALLILFAPWVMRVLGAGFVPEQQAQAVLMTRVLLLAVILQGLAGVCMAVL